MVKNDLFNNAYEKRSVTSHGVVSHTQVLDEVIAFILDPESPPEKISATLEIVYESKNILMNLLQERHYEVIEKLLLSPQIIFTHTNFLLHKDMYNRDIIHYFIEYSPIQLTNEFFKVCRDNAENNVIKTLVQNKYHKKNHLMYIAAKEGASEIFKGFADLVSLTLGRDYLHNMLAEADDEGNNCLMLALKARNLHIIEQILDIIEQTIKENDVKQKFENIIFSQCDSQGNNILILLANTNDNTLQTTYELIVEKFKGLPVTLLLQSNIEKNDVLMLALMSHNEFILNESMKILESLDEQHKKSSLQKVLSNCNIHNENCITLTFKTNQIDKYLLLIRIIEESLEQKLIMGIFKQIFDMHNDFLQDVFTSNNIDAIMSVMKYIELTDDSLGKGKQYVAELILKKDQNNNSLLLSSVQSANIEICKLILDIAQESCNKTDIIRLINSRSNSDMTCYMLAKSSSHQDLVSVIKDFAQKTDNLCYIDLQEAELKNMLCIQHSHHSLIIHGIRT